MIGLIVDRVFGPLMVPECVRASRRSWVIWLRLLPAVVSGLTVLSILYFWMLFQQINPDHLPYAEIRGGLGTIAFVTVALAMLIPAASLAGSLAGEKERGSIGLLLTTQATSFDIVASRWAGGLARIALVGGSALPMLLGLAMLAGLGFSAGAMLLALPAAVAMGVGGMSLGISALARRGRDALMLVLLILVGFLIAPAFGSGFGVGSVATPLGPIDLDLMNPFVGVGGLCSLEDPGPSVLTSLAYLLVGGMGLMVASTRLRPNALKDGSGTSRRGGRGWFRRVPAVGPRPMLWKELHIERGGSLGRAGRIIGFLLVAWLGGGSLALGGLAFLHTTGSAEAPEVSTIAAMYGGSAPIIGFLIEWAVGAWAAVSIASERERGTWDGLLTSPLDGRSIILGKLWGSLHALRWLAASSLVAWSVALGVGAMKPEDYASNIVEVLVVGALTASVGVLMSLRTATATRAMGATLCGWLGLYLLLKVVAWIVTGLIALVFLLGWLYVRSSGLVPNQTSPWFPMSGEAGAEINFCLAALGLTTLFVLYTALQFDRLAGRMTGGKLAVKVDDLFHGRPMAPVKLD